MSYGIVRIQKFKASDVLGIQNHDNRERTSRSNPDINKEKTEQNYNLVACNDFKSSINERLNTLESTKAVRKDAVVMVQLLVTSDKDFFDKLTPKEEQKFFKQALEFISDKYGKDNILAATVHKDEKTPHMHVNIVPIKEHRLTAKTIFDRKGLVALQNDFHSNIGQSWGLKRGESREEKREHLTTEEFKIKTRKEELQKKYNELSYLAIKPDECEPKILKKNLFYKSEESTKHIAERLNKKYIEPLSSEIRNLKQDAYQTANMQKYNEALCLQNEKLIKENQKLQELFKGVPEHKKRGLVLRLLEESSKHIEKVQEQPPVKEKTQNKGQDR